MSTKAVHSRRDHKLILKQLYVPRDKVSFSGGLVIYIYIYIHMLCKKAAKKVFGRVSCTRAQQAPVWARLCSLTWTRESVSRGLDVTTRHEMTRSNPLTRAPRGVASQ